MPMKPESPITKPLKMPRINAKISKAIMMMSKTFTVFKLKIESGELRMRKILFSILHFQLSTLN